MSIQRLVKEGWFDPTKCEIDLDLTDKQIKDIKNGNMANVIKDGKYYIVYLTRGFDLANLKQEDVIVRHIPYWSER